MAIGTQHRAASSGRSRRSGASAGFRRRRARRLLGLLALGACVIGITAVPASAQSITFTFYGRGNGHGIGMSQWGAQGAAQQGWTASRILAWFYRGTSVTKVPATNIRVLLAGYASQFGIGVHGTGELIDSATGVRKTLTSGVNYVVRPSGSGVVVTTPSGAVVDRAAKGARVVPLGSGLVAFNGQPYRGSLSLTGGGGSINATNVVPLELYLRGVVPSEMPSGWAPAALQAQAIAARSYAIRALDPSAPFDVYPDTRSQVYGGVDAEAATSNAAVSGTAGDAVTYHGQVVQAFFAASDGGYTESVQNVWGGSSEPYLVGVPDPFDAIASSHLWQYPPRFTGAQLGNLLGTGGTVTKIAVLKRGVSPRVMLARVTLASGVSVELTGNDIEAYLGLQSTWFWIGQSNLPTPKEPPIGGSSTPPTPTPPTPTTSHRPAGSYLVVLSNSSNLAASRRLFARIAHIAPGEQLITRRHGSQRRYLVVAIRVNSSAAAASARKALKTFGYTSLVMRAIAGDPAPRPALAQTIAAHPTPPPASTPAPAPVPAPAPAPAGGLVSATSGGRSAGAAPAP